MNYKIGLTVLFVILMSSFAYGFGVSTPYWDTKPLQLQPGQSEEVNLLLQNMVGDKDIKLKTKLTEGSEIAVLPEGEKEYLVPFGRKDIAIPVIISIPQNAPIGTKFTVRVAFDQVAEQEGKMVQLAGGVGAMIPVIVVSAEPAAKESQLPSSAATIVALLIIALVIFIISLMLRKARKRKK